MNEIEKELYKKAEEYALQLRIDYEFYEKRIDAFELCKKLNIKVFKYSSFTKKKKRLF